MQLMVNTTITPALKLLEADYSNDAYALSLEQIFEALEKSFVDIKTEAGIVASNFVEDVNTDNKKRFNKSIENALGVDLNNIVQNEGLSDILIASTRENVSLITSIPDQYFKDIESIVWTGTTQGSDAGSMISQIQKRGKTTRNRAKLIARDQTAKINSALTQQRAQNVGSNSYVWLTAGDDRVRETHKRNNGKTFKWSDPPPATGHPGNDIQCRCLAQPIIDF